MLRALEVRDFVIIDSASLELGAGFTALTGETGAGKSLLVDAVELLVGGRAEAGVVREGRERAELAAEFDVPPEGELQAWLESNELQGDPDRLLLRRTLDRSGRSRCFVNGHVATLSQLREAGELAIDIHGQHAHQSLLRPAAQRALLDAHAEAQPLATETAAAYREWQRLEKLATEAEKQHAEREAERAEVKDQAEGLRRLAPLEGEWERLSVEIARLAHGSALLAGAQSSLETLVEAEGAALPQLAAVASRLRSLSQHDDRLSPVVDLLESAEAQATEAARELRHYASRVELDPQALRETEARIEAMHAAARRHRVAPEALPQRLAELEERLAELALSADPKTLQRAMNEARSRYEATAKKLSGRRSAAALALSKAVTSAMQELAMAGGKFSVELRPLDAPSAAGLEEIEFQVASHASLPLRALAKVASGGELSRISLAVQLVAARNSPVGTLVFDEIDSGIGGKVADTIGRALGKLGAERQVLCVTHLPQVAACADAQWSVRKGGTKSKVAAQAVCLDRAARIEELARMLGGAEATARRHAAELIEGR